MPTRYLVLAATALLATVSAARADVFQGTYTAVDTGTSPYNPTINDDGGSFLPSPFSGSLTVGQPVSTTFLQVAPVAASSSIGTIMGSISIAMTITGPGGSAITGLSVSPGGNGATLSNGTIDFLANYELFYGNQTDCLSWNSVTCTPTNNSTTPGETLKVTFADDAVMDITLYNWSDWNMSPQISFDLISGPGTLVPEPASFAVLGTALLGLGVMLRRRSGGKAGLRLAFPA